MSVLYFLGGILFATGVINQMNDMSSVWVLLSVISIGIVVVSYSMEYNK